MEVSGIINPNLTRAQARAGAGADTHAPNAGADAGNVARDSVSRENDLRGGSPNGKRAKVSKPRAKPKRAKASKEFDPERKTGLDHRNIPADPYESVPTSLSEWDLSTITGDEAKRIMQICDVRVVAFAAFLGCSPWFIRSRKILGSEKANVLKKYTRALRAFVGEHDYRMALEEIRCGQAHVPQSSVRTPDTSAHTPERGR